MHFTLPELPYAFDALEPNIDARTMEIHHGKHHAGYTAKLNAAVEGTDMAGMAIEDILRRGADALPGAVRNNGGGYANHNLFWQVMTPGGNRDTSDELKAAVDAVYTDFDGFTKAFSDAAATRFGSGWAWLVVKPGGGVEVYSTANQDSPYMKGDTPILGLDVWEHAYYLHYQNRRPDYIEAFFKVINWAKVSELYAAATGG